jgi:hypothetical protein
LAREEYIVCLSGVFRRPGEERDRMREREKMTSTFSFQAATFGARISISRRDRGVGGRESGEREIERLATV